MEISDRVNEIISIFKKLNELNSGIECFEEYDTFKKICNGFIRNGHYVHGEIKIAGTKRIICYNFSDSVNCMLKFDSSV